jgi:solute carrier family 25 carnitine/acylcarnitine transporter 20/29
MSAAVIPPVPPGAPLPADNPQQKNGGAKNYKGFVGGVFSGIAKLSGASLASCEII